MFEETIVGFEDTVFPLALAVDPALVFEEVVEVLVVEGFLDTVFGPVVEIVAVLVPEVEVEAVLAPVFEDEIVRTS